MNRVKAILRAGILLATLLLAACAGITERGIQKPSDAARAARLAEARDLAVALGARNRDLSSFKGVGRFKLWQGERFLSSRAAWVGAYPDKLRIAVLNTVGQPTASLAADGEYLTMVSHPDGKFYKKAAANPTLQQLISIPISVNDIISILTGRLPIREYHTAELAADAFGRGYVLSLARKWRGVTEKIYLDSDKRSVLQVDIFKSPDELSYRTVFQGEHPVDNFRLPARITISDSRGNRFELDVDKFWTDVPQLPSTFVLTPP